MIIAHKDSNTNQIQSLTEHLFNVANNAESLGNMLGLGSTSYLIGLLHDLGKADTKFQNMIINNTSDKVNHSSAGAKYLNLIREERSDNIYEKRPNFEKFESYHFEVYMEIMIYVIESHHGLFDVNKINKGEIINQLIKRTEYDTNGKYDFDGEIREYITELDKKVFEEKNMNIETLIKKGYGEFHEIIQRLNETEDIWNKNSYSADFYIHAFTRLLLSILKNSDILDTINAYEDIIVKTDNKEIEEYISSALNEVNNLYESYSNPTTEINKVRNNISKIVRKRGEADNTGVYRLNLPTGAGKTNLTLLYSLLQIKNKQKDRMVYIAPFLSILEQNASDIRAVIKDDTHILEHHSNVVKDDNNLSETEEDSSQNAYKQYFMDTRDDVIILSTMVQFSNTLFKEKSANIRRFFSLANSVIIIDEVQSLQIETTYIMNLMFNFLTKVMNSTVVLCSATQPLYDYEGINYKISYGDINRDNKDLVILSDEEKEVFDRTIVKLLNDGKETYIDNIIEFVGEKIEKSILIILNTKKAVLKAYEGIKDIYKPNNIYYLTTNMCPKHRQDKILEIKEKLKNGEKVICVSSQLIEAGVNLDFELLIRSYAGIDSIIQAMGRCNRENKLTDKGEVFLVNLDEKDENISSLTSIKNKKESTKSVLDLMVGEINISELNDKFYRNYFANNSKYMDYRIGENKSVFDYLSSNDQILVSMEDESETIINQSFLSAAKAFNLIDEDNNGMIVYYKNDILIEELISLTDQYIKTYDTKLLPKIKNILKKLQLYTVNVYNMDHNLREKLIDTKGLKHFDINILSKPFYDKNKGVIEEATFDSFII